MLAIIAANLQTRFSQARSKGGHGPLLSSHNILDKITELSSYFGSLILICIELKTHSVISLTYGAISLKLNSKQCYNTTKPR